MNILICDDLRQDADHLVRLLHDTGVQLTTTVFSCGSDVLDHLQTGAAIDVCFLDIVMPGLDGIELARALREGGYSGAIVFLTMTRDFGPESYEVNAFSYLLKPPSAASVSALLGALVATAQREDTAGILLKRSGIVRDVLLRDIAYVEALGHEVVVHLTDGGSAAVNDTFTRVTAPLLGDPRFARCHRSYVVNLDEIAQLSKGVLVLRGGVRIAITRTYQTVRNQYFRRKFGRDDP